MLNSKLNSANLRVVDDNTVTPSLVSKVLDSINVLVIDDNAFTRSVVSKMLDNMGVASVVLAASGEEALQILHHADSSIDIVVCDIEMPTMDGFAFTRRLRYGTIPKYQNVPILILTGEVTDENLQRGALYKIDAFLTKPPTEEMLRTKILQALR